MEELIVSKIDTAESFELRPKWWRRKKIKKPREGGLNNRDKNWLETACIFKCKRQRVLKHCAKGLSTSIGLR